MRDDSNSLDDFVGREPEQRCFADLLTLQGDSRLLTIRDVGGKGKSLLLRKLKQKCLWDNKPVSLIDLEYVSDSFSLITMIKAELYEPPFFTTFPDFDAKMAALATNDFEPFARSPSAITGVVHNEGSSVSGGTVAGTIGTNNNYNRSTVIHLIAAPEWNQAKEAIAINECIRAFYQELKAYCESHPVVVLMDTWEECNERLKEWIFLRLVKPYCIDTSQRPAKFVACIAGKQVPNLEPWITDELQRERLVTSISRLSPVTEGELRQFVEQKNFSVSDEEVTLLCRTLNSPTGTFDRILQYLSLSEAG